MVEFFFIGQISGAWQQTFITLILKRLEASEPSHLRSISLCMTLQVMYEADVSQDAAHSSAFDFSGAEGVHWRLQ